MSRTNGKSTQLVAFLLGGVGLFVLMTYVFGVWGTSSRASYHALLDDAAGIVANNAVKIAGVQVGKVEMVGVEGKRARLALKIDADLKLYKNSSVSVRAKSLLGEKYIQLDPGTQDAPVLQAGAEIAQGGATFEVDQLLNSLRSVVGEEEPMGQRLASILARSDRLMARLEEPEVEAAMKEDLERVRSLLDETAGLAKSLRLVLDGQEAYLQRKLKTAATWLGDPRWAKIVARMDTASAQLEQELPGLLASTRATAQASASLLSRADAKLDERTLASLASSIQDLAEISKQGRVLTKDLARIQRKLKQGPLRAEEVGELLHALTSISKRAAKLDEPTLRRFLQREGVKVYFGRGADARKTLERQGVR